MSNKQFEWTDELVIEFCEKDKLGLPFKTYLKYFKEMKVPKPLHTTTDGVDLYELTDRVYFITGLCQPLSNLHAISLITADYPTFSTLEAVASYNNLHKKQFSIADVQYLLTRSSYGNQFIDSVIEALTKYDKK